VSVQSAPEVNHPPESAVPDRALVHRGGYRGGINFVENHKGDLTLALSFMLYLSSWVFFRDQATYAGQLVRAMGEAALVGGLCDYIALKMIFERRWYLPNSGVLPRNRVRLIEGIAATIETQWLTPQMIGAKLHELDLVKRLGRYLEDASVEQMLGREHFARLCGSVAGYLDSPAFLDFVEERLAAQANTALRLAHTIGLVNFHDLAGRIGRQLRRAIAELPANTELLGKAEGWLHHLGDELQQRDSTAREMAYRIMDLMVEHAVTSSRGQIAQMVKDNLSRLSDDEIRRQIESRTRTHLDWIRVNGGLFGSLFGAAFGSVNFAIAHSAQLLPLIVR
jgi:uncharacterized membrane-anchored protein YjiN (DUF445 family)